MKTRTNKDGKTQYLCTLNLAHAKDAWVAEDGMYYRNGKDGKTPYRHKDCEKVDSVRRHAVSKEKAVVKEAEKITRKSAAKKPAAKKTAARKPAARKLVAVT